MSQSIVIIREEAAAVDTHTYKHADSEDEGDDPKGYDIRGSELSCTYDMNKQSKKEQRPVHFTTYPELSSM